MFSDSRPTRRWAALPLIGGALVIFGLAIGVFRLLRLFYVSTAPATSELIQTPVDSFPSGYQLWIVNSSMVVGVALVFVGAILIALWVGHVVGSRRTAPLNRPGSLAVPGKTNPNPSRSASDWPRWAA
jgi:hypothetical protein